jgi:hypothetical protein
MSALSLIVLVALPLNQPHDLSASMENPIILTPMLEDGNVHDLPYCN